VELVKDISLSITFEEVFTLQKEAKVSADYQLVQDYLAGNEKCLDIIYEKYSGKMYSICRRYIKDPEEARDVLHDSFIKVFLHLKNFRFESALETWMTRIIINTALNHVKREVYINLKQNINNKDFADEKGFESSYPEDISAEKLLEIMQELPVGYRTVLNLYVFEELNHKEIAKILKITEATSRSQLFKARIMMKLMLKKRLML